MSDAPTEGQIRPVPGAYSEQGVTAEAAIPTQLDRLAGRIRELRITEDNALFRMDYRSAREAANKRSAVQETYDVAYVWQLTRARMGAA